MTVFSDSRATLENAEAYQASGERRSPLTEAILAATKALVDQGFRVGIHWVPGDEGVPGNVFAGIVARRAVNGIVKDQKMDNADMVTVPGEQDSP